MYQMGSKTLAESIGTSKEEAQKIIDDFYSGFPKVKKWVSGTLDFVREKGYVEDFWGRRRRLPDVHLPKYRIVNTNNISNGLTFNPILHCSGINREEKDPLITKYENALKNVRGFKDVNIIKKQAEAEKVEIHDNTGFISQAERQCVNARVQGGAASMSKIALRKVYDDEELNKLGFKLLLQIHDEFIGECPKENSDLVAERLTKVMKESVSDIIKVPFKCDPDIASCWYYNDYSDILNQDYQGRLKDNGEGALQSIYEDYCECTPEQINEMLNI